MELNDFILKLRKHLKRNIISILIIPLLTFVIVFTFYGNDIQTQILNNFKNFSFIEINTYKNLLGNAKEIPMHIKSFVNVMVVFIIVIFYYYLVLYIYSCYKKLSENRLKLTLGIVEFIVLLIIQVVVISPGMQLFYKIIGYVPFVVLLGIAVIFKIYFLKLLHEKK